MSGRRRHRRRTWKGCHCQRKIRGLEGMPLSEEDEGPGRDANVERKIRGLEGMPLSEEDKGPGRDATVRGR